MAAARGIVASKSGGMAEMIGKCNGGLLIDPNDVSGIVDAVTSLLQNEEKRISYGIRCREQILNYYSSNELIEKLLEQYRFFAKGNN